MKYTQNLQQGIVINQSLQETLFQILIILQYQTKSNNYGYIVFFAIVVCNTLIFGFINIKIEVISDKAKTLPILLTAIPLIKYDLAIMP